MHYYFKCPFLLSLSLVILVCLFSQSVVSQNTNDALVEKYNNAEYVIREAIIDIDILKNENTGEPQITHKETLVFQSLKNNAQVVCTYFHKNNSSIEKIKGKKFQQISGNAGSEMVFHSDYKFISFSKTLRNKGDIGTLQTLEKYNDFKFYAREFFNREAPIINETIRFNVDTAIQCKILLFNTDDLEVEHDVVLNGNIKSNEYKISNVPAYKKENKATPIYCNYPHAIINIQSYLSKTGEKIPVFETIDDLYGMYKRLITKTKNDTAVLRPVLNTIVSNPADTLQMVSDIFRWVQQKIRYIAFEYEMQGYIPEDAQKVVENRYGDCKGMANLLKTFLTMQGLDARLCWLNATENPYNYSIPSFVIDNHMICACIYHGKPMFLDATNPYINIKDIDDLLQGKQIIIENGDSPWLFQVPFSSFNTNVSNYIFNLEPDISYLKGTMSAQIKGNKRGLMMAYFKDAGTTTKVFIENAILNRVKNIEWSNDDNSLQISNDSLISFSSDIKVKGSVFTNGNQMFVKMCQAQNIEIQQEDTTRENDITIPVRDYIVEQVNFKIPKEYKVTVCPEDTVIMSPIGKMSYAYSVSDTLVKYCRIYSNNKLVLPVEKIGDWNAFVKKVADEDNRRVVLERTIKE